ncbi:hypothetical protein [Sphaerobacter thermophilus]|uniref:hypothetical protein n=1 Tax=Sphaerobacter thermophilus TaxID=2057 RepID=UPI0011D16995|nr:hypothetical protein [Sphaerobacter thermophilus]
MVNRGCPFGGSPGQWRSLQPSQPPTEGYRIIAGSTWWTLLHWPWRLFVSARAAGISASPPPLAPPGAQFVFFTDRESLEGVHGPADFARRMGLPTRAHQACSLYGCAIVRFTIPADGEVYTPVPPLGARQGLTGGGAREWCLVGNLPLDETMEVVYVDVDGNGPRWYHLPL